MDEIIDKIVLFLFCISLYLFLINNSFFIVPAIICAVLSSLLLYYEDIRVKLSGILLFAILCVFLPEYIVFLPVLLYDIIDTRFWPAILSVPLLILAHLSEYKLMVIIYTILFLGLTFLLKYKTAHLHKLNNDFNDLRDSSVHMALQLEKQNRDLLKNQDYEINLATLNERNRISKDIHDNVGHLLSRALLQVGALQVITSEEAAKEGLQALKESLSVGMDQIRSSIHNMYDESVDLYLQIENLVKDFTFCEISYEYDIKNPPELKLKYSLIAITKEALANAIRHSNATKINILLREHPAMYQLVIQDNGTLDSQKQKTLSKLFDNLSTSEGMGLRNIYDRVKSFGGNVNLSTEHGFKIFITIPKNAA